MRHTVALLVLASCYRGGTAPAPTPTVQAQPPRAPNPEARFAVADGATLRVMHLAPDGALTVERETAVSGAIDVLIWSGADPAVWIERDIPWHGAPWVDDAAEGGPPKVAHTNDMGLVTATGYHPFAPLAWPKVPKPSDKDLGDMMSEASWDTLIGAVNGEVWQGHCAWFGGPDGGWCGAFTYARRAPSDGPFVAKEPERDDDRSALPVIPASRSTDVVVAKHLAPGEDDDGQDHWDSHHTVHCKAPGAAMIEWPDRDTPDPDPDRYPPEIQQKTVYWIANEPPIYQVDTSFSAGVGPAPDPAYVVFEGCAPSKRYSTAFGGPHQLSVVVGAQLAVMWKGREVAHAAIRGHLVAFAP